MAGVEELIAHIAVNLVDHADEVRIRRFERDGREVYEVSVHPEDRGALIGKGGQTARAIRSLLMAVSARTGRRLDLEIAE